MPGQTESEIRQQLIGTWRLVLTEETLKDGTRRPFPQFGAQGMGFLMYQPDGYMCAVLVNPNRVAPVDATPEAKASMAEGTFAYCGRYEVDAGKSHVVHLPEVATNPGYVGSRQIRPYRFEGNRLILSDVEKDDTVVERWKIVWEKVC